MRESKFGAREKMENRKGKMETSELAPLVQRRVYGSHREEKRGGF
jgi:hypothetical protein